MRRINKLDVSQKDKAAIDLFITDAVTAGEKAVNKLNKSVDSIIARHDIDTGKLIA